ncbi:MAG: hypothetical protein WCH65_00700 [bacterium]
MLVNSLRYIADGFSIDVHSWGTTLSTQYLSGFGNSSDLQPKNLLLLVTAVENHQLNTNPKCTQISPQNLVVVKSPENTLVDERYLNVCLE